MKHYDENKVLRSVSRVARVEGKHHVRGRGLTGEVIGRRIQPFILVDLVALDAREPILVADPALDGLALGLRRPAVGQPPRAAPTTPGIASSAMATSSATTSTTA